MNEWEKKVFFLDLLFFMCIDTVKHFILVMPFYSLSLRFVFFFSIDKEDWQACCCCCVYRIIEHFYHSHFMPCMHLMLETFINIPYVSIHQHFYFHVEWGMKFIAHCVLAEFFSPKNIFFLSFTSFKINFSIIFDSIASQSAYLLATKAVIKHYTIFIISTYFSDRNF